VLCCVYKVPCSEMINNRTGSRVYNDKTKPRIYLLYILFISEEKWRINYSFICLRSWLDTECHAVNLFVFNVRFN
jgi:hypothetical protein